MNIKRKALGVGCMAAALAWAAFGTAGAISASAATVGHLHFRDYNVPGAAATALVGINNHGDLSGKYWDKAGNAHIFMTVGSVITTWVVPGAVGTPYISNINNARDVVGTYNDASGVSHGYLRTPTGHFIYLNDPHQGTQPGAGIALLNVNDRNDVCGIYEDSNGVIHGFVYRDGVYTTIDVPGATETDVQVVNDAGVLGGDYIDASGVYHGFIDTHGHIIVINAPRAGHAANEGTVVDGISKDGVVIGYVATSSGLDVGWMLKDWNYSTLNDPKAGNGPGEGTVLNSIAEDGSAADGIYWDSAGNLHSFILDL